MENTFQLSRMAKLGNKFLREHVKFYAGCALVFLALQTTVYFLNATTSRTSTISHEDQAVFFAIGMYLGLFIITVISFSDYNHPRSVFTSIMLPASTFEKYMLRWCLTLIGFTLVAWPLYHLVQYFFAGYIAERFFLWNMGERALRWIVLLYLLVHSAAFLGAVSFKKRTVVSTALTIFVILVLFVYLNHRLTLMNGSSLPFPFLPLSISTPEGPAKAVIQNNESWAIACVGLLTLLLWSAAYFKLKEREV